jgi:hypothetical protein
VIEKSITSESFFDVRVVLPSRVGDPYYVLMCVRRGETMTVDEYRQARQNLLAEYCHVVKHKWREAQQIVGIATESGLGRIRSEDLLYYDASTWTAENETHAIEIQKQFGFLQKTRMTRGVSQEYPVDHRGINQEKIQARNALCKCGSRKRFRNCCGRKFHPKKKKK